MTLGRGPFVLALAAVVAGCSLLAGCAGAVLQPPLDLDVPANWSATSDRGDWPSASWWTDFADSRLDEIVSEALERNHDLQAAAANLEAAEAMARAAGADLYPQLGAGLSSSRSKRNFIGFKGLAPSGADTAASSSPIATTSSLHGLSMDLSWELDLWGRVRAGREAASADAQSAAAVLEGARLSLSAQVAKTWFSLIEANEQLALAEATVASYEASAQQVDARYQRGVRPSLDLRLALAQLATAAALVEQREAQVDALSRQLEVLLGRYPKGALLVDATLPAPPPAVPAGLPADLIARRPDVAAAEQRFVAADSRVREAKAALYPRFSLTGSAGTSTDELSSLLDGDFSVWSLAAGIVQPVFQGGRLRAAVAANQAGRKAELADYASTVINAYSEVETALAADRLLAQQIERLAEADRQSAAAKELAEQRYLSGLDDYVTVLTAQRRALDARSALIGARRERLLTRVDLYLALGGGFTTAALPPAQGKS